MNFKKIIQKDRRDDCELTRDSGDKVDSKQAN